MELPRFPFALSPKGGRARGTGGWAVSPHRNYAHSRTRRQRDIEQGTPHTETMHTAGQGEGRRWSSQDSRMWSSSLKNTHTAGEGAAGTAEEEMEQPGAAAAGQREYRQYYNFENIDSITTSRI